MNAIHYFFIGLISLSCTFKHRKDNVLIFNKPDLKGHWQLYDTEIVDEVPFLNLHASKPDPNKIAFEDSPWDSYTKFDLVFEEGTMYKVNYPIQAFATLKYFVDTGYLHVGPKDSINTYPVELVNDTLAIYTPLRSEPGYFREKYLRTNFNDTTLSTMKKYGINYPELAGKWMLVREEDYDYGTHYELKFPHSIPDSIEFTQQQMIAALEGEKIYMMLTDGVKRDYSFYYRKPHIYFKPGKWYKKEDPMIHFY